MKNYFLVTPKGLRYKKLYYKCPFTGKEFKYKLFSDGRYYSKRYKKYIYLKSGKKSDGATGAFDILSDAWWYHDELCDSGKFADGSPCTNIQASFIIFDILFEEGRFIRAFRWFFATLFLGGGKARENGMFVLKEGIN